MEKSTISDDQQALHMEERAIADIYRARKERRRRILRENVPVAFLGGLLRLWEKPMFQAECPKCHENAYCTGGGGSPLSGAKNIAVTCGTCGHQFGTSVMKADVNATSFGKALIASINSSNAGLGSMDDESLPIEDVVHILELEESNAKRK